MTNSRLVTLVLMAALGLPLGCPAGEPLPEAAAESDPDLAFALRLESAFKKLAKRVAPCVVSLQVKVKQGNWLEELRRMNEHFGPSPEQSDGSGVVIDATGLIITNEHVIRGAESIRVTLHDGRVFPAEVAGTDARSDLAMIRLVGDSIPKELPTAVLADSDRVEVGQWAMAVGNPFGLANTLTMGVVSARKRNVQIRNFAQDVFYGNLIQTDAAINPGNSGGPLFDLRGQLIGINTMIFSKSGVSQGFGFAIPINHLKPRLAYLKAGEEIQYGWLGVQLEDIRPDQRAFKIPENKGVQVARVLDNTPADRAGILAGMIILKYENERIANSHELIAAVNETPVGRAIKLLVLDRSGQEKEVSVRVSKRHSETVRAAVLGLDSEDMTESPLDEEEPGDTENKVRSIHQWRGMVVREILPEAAPKKGGRLEIIRVKKGTPADRAGLYEGALITEIKHEGEPAIQKVTTLQEFKRITATITGQAAVHVPLDGYVTVEP